MADFKMTNQQAMELLADEEQATVCDEIADRIDALTIDLKDGRPIPEETLSKAELVELVKLFRSYLFEGCYKKLGNVV